MGNTGSSSQRHARRRDDDGWPNHQHSSADQETQQYTLKQLAIGAVVTGAAALFAPKFVVGAAVAAVAAGTAIRALSSSDTISNDSDAAKKSTQRNSFINQEDSERRRKSTVIEEQKPIVEGHGNWRHRVAWEDDVFSYVQEDLDQRWKTAVEDQKPTVEGHLRRKRTAIKKDLFSYIPGNINQKSATRKITIMCYNIWGLDVKLNERMEEIGRMVQKYSPDIVLFQEVLPDIYEKFERSKWREEYACSDLPQNGKTHFCMVLSKLSVEEFSFKSLKKFKPKRKLCLARIDDGFGNKLVIASTHFKRAEDNDSHKEMRVGQAKSVVSMLSSFPNAIFGGDMNWDDDEDKDGAFPLKKGWVDAWKHLKPEKNGWTYDTESNPMLSSNRTLQKRFDRFICKLRDFKLTSLSRIGKQAIPGIYNRSGQKKVPVLASDHYGLLLEIDLA